MKDYLVNMDGVFNNKLNIKDDIELLRLEISNSADRLVEIQENPFQFRGDFSHNHIKNLHGYILQDTYDINEKSHMAGKFREMKMQILENVFSQPSNINEDIDKLSKQIAGDERLQPNHPDAVAAITEHSYRFWEIHPFRDSNTRTTQGVMILLADKAGLSIDIDQLHKGNDLRDNLVGIMQAKQVDKFNREGGFEDIDESISAKYILQSYIAKAVNAGDQSLYYANALRSQDLKIINETPALAKLQAKIEGVVKASGKPCQNDRTK